MTLFEQITSIDNLFASWKAFRSGKRAKFDVQRFERNLETELFALRDDLQAQRYRHGSYQPFTITDPKLRHIHKATVRDRILHHAFYRVLYPIFDSTYIYDSYSCRIGKGTHAAVRRLERFTWKVSQNYTRPCWVLKCDIRKFFDSVDHNRLLDLLFRRVTDERTRRLLNEIVGSYTVSQRERERERARGIPIGNLTSQLFANVYMNKFDQFAKHQLRAKHYLRYTDDFIFLDQDLGALQQLIPLVQQFLGDSLRLQLHPQKVEVRKLTQGIDFLGYVVLPHHRVLRTRTKRRMLLRVSELNLPSYVGLLEHCNGFKIQERITALAQQRGEECTGLQVQEWF